MRKDIERRSPAFSALPTLRAQALGLLAATLIAIPAMAQAQSSKPAPAQPDKVIAKVQGVEIHESDLAMAEEDMGQQVAQLQGDAKRDALVGYLADVINMSKAAEAKKITDQKDFKTRIAFIRNKLAMEMLLIEEGKAAATDAAMKKVYEEAVAKAGTTNLRGVYEYAAPIDTTGMVFMDSPGFDPVSATGQVASGANLICFTTGRGSAYGCVPAPSLKLSTNTATWQRQEEDMDLNCGEIIDGTASIEEMGERILRMMIDCASGVKSKSEIHGYGQDEFVPWQIGAVM